MSNNAQWWVDCDVTYPSGDKRHEMVSLASPDLTNVKEAHRRARKAAQERLLKKLRKGYGVSGHLVKVVATRSRCVG